MFFYYRNKGVLCLPFTLYSLPLTLYPEKALPRKDHPQKRPDIRKDTKRPDIPQNGFPRKDIPLRDTTPYEKIREKSRCTPYPFGVQLPLYPEGIRTPKGYGYYPYTP